MSTTTSPPGVETDEFESLAKSVDEASAAVQALDEPARSRALELKTAIEAFHKLGITRIVKALRAEPRGKELLFGLVDDPAVYALLLMHGIVRSDPKPRIERVLETLRPYIRSHGGDVELVEFRGGTAYVRLGGSCSGCSMSSATLRNTVEEALREQVPEVDRVEAVPAEPAPSVLPIESLLAPVDLAAAGWVSGPRVEELEEARPRRVDVPGTESSVLLLRLGSSIRAFRNACAHMGLPLERGPVDSEAGTLTCPWHGFVFDARTGECLTAAQAQLEPLPCRVQDGIVWVRPG